MAKKKKSNVPPDINKKNFNFISDGIKKNPLYKMMYSKRKEEAKTTLLENCDRVNGNIVPGQVLYFKYYEPKTKDELEYYDANPLTIFFCAYNSSQGKRVIGFNIHYYPPQMRYRIVNMIYKLFTPMFKSTWDDGLNTAAQFFSYDFIINELEKFNLSFGVRQYDPSLMADVRIVPTKWLSTACFTEGNFKKRTREQILSYWRKWKPGK